MHDNQHTNILLLVGVEFLQVLSLNLSGTLHRWRDQDHVMYCIIYGSLHGLALWHIKPVVYCNTSLAFKNNLKKIFSHTPFQPPLALDVNHP